MSFSEAFEQAAVHEFGGFERMQVFMRGVDGPETPPPTMIYPNTDRARLGAWGASHLHPVAEESPAGMRWLCVDAIGERLHEVAAREAIPEFDRTRELGPLAAPRTEEILLMALELTGCVGFVGLAPGHLLVGGIPPIGRAPRTWCLVGSTANRCEMDTSVRRIQDVIDGVVRLRRRPTGWLRGVTRYLEGHGFDARPQGPLGWTFVSLRYGEIRVTLHDNGMLETCAARPPAQESLPH